MALGYSVLLKFGLIPLAIGGVILVKQYWPSYKDDNQIEEIIEKVLEAQTGLDVDITPLSKEENNAAK
jgi:hypothetical protein